MVKQTNERKEGKNDSVKEPFNDTFDELGLDIISVTDTPVKQKKIAEFMAEPKKNKSTVLIVYVDTDTPKVWTIAMFNDEGEFVNNELVNDGNNALAIELDREKRDNDKIIKLATSYLGLIPFDRFTINEKVDETSMDCDPSASDSIGAKLKNTDIYPHVKRTFLTAQVLAGDKPINAGIALRAALITGKSESSIAFNCLSRILSIKIKERSVDISFVELSNCRFNALLARSLSRTLQHVHSRESERQMLGREYIATAILCTTDHSLAQIATEGGTSITELQDSWFKFVTTEEMGRPSKLEEWKRWWKEADVPIPGERAVRAGYLAEATKGEDKLGIKRDAHAFARLIADPKTKPPLAIGLVGDWGSGKSFIMETMKKEVNSIMGTHGLCNNVAQVSFNAWHMSDANLWASIVDHIFTGISEQMTPKDNIKEARKVIRELIKDAEGAVSEADGQVEVARKALNEAQKKHLELVTALETKKILKEESWDELSNAAKKIGWSLLQIKGTVDLEHGLSQLHQSGQRVKNVLHVALWGKARSAAIPWACGSVIIAGLIVYFGSDIGLQQSQKYITVAGGIISSFTSAIVAPLVKANTYVTKFTDKLEAAVTESQNEINNNDALKKAQQEYEAVEENLRNTQQRLTDLENRHESLDPSQRLTTFIQERARSEDYRSKQGIISLVRRDFEMLVKQMDDWVHDRTKPRKRYTEWNINIISATNNTHEQIQKQIQNFEKNPKENKRTVLIANIIKDTPKEWTIAAFNGKGEYITKKLKDEQDNELAIELNKEEHNNDRYIELATSYLGIARCVEPVDRIVLYIDDLDRCSHEIVVQTLEAIHLLLALDLFIVIVAVDSRWLLRSLEVHYSNLLSGTDHIDEGYRISTPQSYLEKIFQITYAVAPMSVRGYSEYVDYLTSSAATEPVTNKALLNKKVLLKAVDVPAQTDVDDKDKGKTQGATRSTMHEKGQAPVKQGAQSSQVTTLQEKGDQMPTSRPLNFVQYEQQLLKKLHPLVTTPRIAKRLVNIYRLIKARAKFTEINDFETEDGRHRPILLLLAILFGRPTLSEYIFRMLCERKMPGSGQDCSFHDAVCKLSIESDTVTESQSEQEGKESLVESADQKQQGIAIENKSGEKDLVQIKESAHTDQVRKSDKIAMKLRNLANTIKEIAPNISLSECEKEAADLARYSLITGQAWHTWSLPEEESPKTKLM